MWNAKCVLTDCDLFPPMDFKLSSASRKLSGEKNGDTGEDQSVVVGT